MMLMGHVQDMIQRLAANKPRGKKEKMLDLLASERDDHPTTRPATDPAVVERAIAGRHSHHGLPRNADAEPDGSLPLGRIRNRRGGQDAPHAVMPRRQTKGRHGTVRASLFHGRKRRRRILQEPENSLPLCDVIQIVDNRSPWQTELRKNWKPAPRHCGDTISKPRR